ncbi:hypothetical protein F4777DRAFT_578608 [Nemania sp. FL0916]|nr:hypothetical protein F4777DRAFT_578608 [Nemania sp. FL0916]
MLPQQRQQPLNPQHQPFTCTFCWRPSTSRPYILGPSARLTCATCFRGLIDLAVCWACGSVVCRGDECVSLGWCFWHRACYGCLFCGCRRVVTAPGVGEMFDDEDGDDEDEGEGEIGREWEWERERERGRGKGREIVQIPLCANCLVQCERDDAETLLKKALDRIDLADGGLSRLRWKAMQANAKSTPVSVSALIPRNGYQLGGDSTVDMPPAASDIPLTEYKTVTEAENLGQIESRGTNQGERDDETIARLHYKRSSKDPRFAELECVVPLTSAIYVSLFDPLHPSSAFKPYHAKPVPEWMRLLPSERNGQGDEARPRSILDVHFPPAEMFARREAVSPRAQEVEMGTQEKAEAEEGIEPGMDAADMEMNPLRGPAAARSSSSSTTRAPIIITSPPPPPLPPRHDAVRRQTSSESIGSHLSSDLSDAESVINKNNDDTRSRSPSPPIDFRFPAAASSAPYKHPSTVADEPLTHPSARRILPRKIGEGNGASAGSASPGTATTASAGASPSTMRGDTNTENGNTDLSTSTSTMKAEDDKMKNASTKSEGKAKKCVVWDKDVAGGETETDTDTETGTETTVDTDADNIAIGSESDIKSGSESQGSLDSYIRTSPAQQSQAPNQIPIPSLPGQKTLETPPKLRTWPPAGRRDTPTSTITPAAPISTPAAAPGGRGTTTATGSTSTWPRTGAGGRGRGIQTQTSPAQSNEFLDLYRAHQTEEMRLPSLAVPGRWRGPKNPERGGICEKCGNKLNQG